MDFVDFELSNIIIKENKIMEKSLNNQIVCIYSNVDNSLFLDRTSTGVILYKKNRAINRKRQIFSTFNAQKNNIKISQ
ncbi:hypothetical protein [Clostridium cuniculi]|uniref:hypothetical protein n=1 Tax=Clostridium cuniculi TaxID=2548455 RepID=UPI001056BC9F|nr:hypothetical protein [Clostridium cuniculi]